MADIEAKVLRILHNYAFYESPSSLIRATAPGPRLFHWTLEERTSPSLRCGEGKQYTKMLRPRAGTLWVGKLTTCTLGQSLETLRLLEKIGWLKYLAPHLSVAKVDWLRGWRSSSVRQQIRKWAESLSQPIVM